MTEHPFLLADTANPVHRAIENVGGPELTWIVIGIPMLAVAIWIIYIMIRTTNRHGKRDLQTVKRYDTDGDAEALATYHSADESTPQEVHDGTVRTDPDQAYPDPAAR